MYPNSTNYFVEIFQEFFLLFLLIVKTLLVIKINTSIFQLVFMVILRMFVLEKIFTKQELIALDDIVPTFSSVVSPKKTARKGISLILLFDITKILQTHVKKDG